MPESHHSDETFDIGGLEEETTEFGPFAASINNNNRAGASGLEEQQHIENIAANDRSNSTHANNTFSTTHSLGISTPGSSALREALLQGKDGRGDDYTASSIDEKLFKDSGRVVEEWSMGAETPQISRRHPPPMPNSSSPPQSTLQARGPAESYDYSLSMPSSARGSARHSRSPSIASVRSSGHSPMPGSVLPSRLTNRTRTPGQHSFGAPLGPANPDRKVSFYGISPESSLSNISTSGGSADDIDGQNTTEQLRTESRISLIEDEAPPDIFDDINTNNFNFRKRRGYTIASGTSIADNPAEVIGADVTSTDGSQAVRESITHHQPPGWDASPQDETNTGSPSVAARPSFARLRSSSEADISQMSAMTPPQYHYQHQHAGAETFSGSASTDARRFIDNPPANVTTSLSMILAGTQPSSAEGNSSSLIPFPSAPVSPLSAGGHNAPYAVSSPMRIHSLIGGYGALGSLPWQQSIMEGIRRFSGRLASTNVASDGVRPSISDLAEDGISDDNDNDAKLADQDRDQGETDRAANVINKDPPGGSKSPRLPTRRPSPSAKTTTSPTQSPSSTKSASSARRSPGPPPPGSRMSSPAGSQSRSSPRAATAVANNRAASPVSPTSPGPSHARSRHASHRSPSASTTVPGETRQVSMTVALSTSSRGRGHGPKSPGPPSTPLKRSLSQASHATRLNSSNRPSSTTPSSNRSQQEFSSALSTPSGASTPASAYKTPSTRMRTSGLSTPQTASTPSTPATVNPLIRRMALHSIVPKIPQTTPRQASKLKAASGLNSAETTPSQSPMASLVEDGSDSHLGPGEGKDFGMTSMVPNASNSLLLRADVEDASTSLSQGLNMSAVLNQFDALQQLLYKDAASVAQELVSSEQAWADMQNELADTQSRLLAANAKVEEYQNLLRTHQLERDEWDGERDDLREQIETWKFDAAKWRQAFEEAEQDRAGVWSDGYKSRAELIATIQELERSLAQVRRELKESQDHAHELADSLDSERHAHTESRKQAEEKIADLSHKLTEREGQFKQSHADLLGQVVSLDKQLQAAKSVSGPPNNWSGNGNGDKQADIEALVESLEEVVAENKQLKKRLASGACPACQGKLSDQEVPPEEGLAGVASNTKKEGKEEGQADKYKQELKRMKVDYDILVESLEEVQERQKEYKQQRDLARKDLESLREDYARLELECNSIIAQKAALEAVTPAASLELTKQLKAELEEWKHKYNCLEAELSSAVRDTGSGRGGLSGYDKSAEGKNAQIKKLEEELESLRVENDALEIEKDLAKQSLAKIEVEMQDLEMQVERLKAERRPDSNAVDNDGEGVKDFDFRKIELSDEVAALSVEIRELESARRTHRQRLELLQKEQHYLCVQLRELLLNNATLRAEVSEVILRRAGKLNELKHLQQQQQQEANSEQSPDERQDGAINLVPSVSQILDGSASIMQDIDSHLADIKQIVDENNSQESGSDALSAPNASSNQRECPTAGPLDRDCGPASVSKLQGALSEAHSHIEQLQGECLELRNMLANYEHESTQLRHEQETMDERITQLMDQIEELDERHQKTQAAIGSAGMVSRRIRRQAAVLLRALRRLAETRTVGTGSALTSPTFKGTGGDAIAASGAMNKSSSQLEELEMDELNALDDDSAMMNALIDGSEIVSRKGGEGSPSIGVGEDDAPGPARDTENMVDPAVIIDDMDLKELDNIISKAYEELKVVRTNMYKARSERLVLLRRLGEQEHRKLPSWELSNKLEQSNRRRSSTFNSTSSLEYRTPENYRSRRMPLKALAEEDELEDEAKSTQRYSNEFEPPMSLFLADESQIMEELGLTPLSNSGNKGARGLSATPASLLRNIAGGGSNNSVHNSDGDSSATDVLAWVSKRESELRRKLAKAEFRLANAQEQVAMLETLVTEQRQTLDRARAELAQCQAENRILGNRLNRPSLTAIPSLLSRNVNFNWDDVEALKSDLEVCKARNQTYFARVGALCSALEDMHMKRVASRTMRRTQRRLRRGDVKGMLPSSVVSGGDGDAGSGELHLSLLEVLSSALGVPATINEGETVKDKVVELAKEVRARIRNKEAMLQDLKSELAEAKRSIAESNGADQASATDGRPSEGLGGGSGSRIQELEQKQAKALAELSAQKVQTQSLTEVISKLQRDYAAVSSDLADAKHERDGWCEHAKTFEKVLEYELEENDILRQQLASQRVAREQSIGSLAFDGDNDAARKDEWERVRAECITFGREREADTWRAALNRVRRTKEVELSFVRWELALWRGLMLGMAKDTIHKAGNVMNGESDDRLIELEQQATMVQADIDQFDAALADIYSRMNDLSDRFVRQEGEDDLDGPAYSRAIDELMQSLEEVRTSSWTRRLVTTFTEAVAVIVKSTLPAQAVGDQVSTAAPAAVGDGGSRHPRLTTEQKRVIRDEMSRREKRLVARLQAETERERAQRRQDRTTFRQAFDSTRRDFNRILDRHIRRQRMLVYECRYLRGRIQLAVARNEACKFEKSVILKLFGASPQSLVRHIDESLPRGPPVPPDQVRQYEARRRWRLVLLLVKFKQRVLAKVEQERALKAIKAKALSMSNRVQAAGARPGHRHPGGGGTVSWTQLGDNSASNSASSSSSGSSSNRDAIMQPDRSSAAKYYPGQHTPSPNGPSQYLMYDKPFIRAGRKDATPLTPSKLRNIVSDLESCSPSTSSSFN